MSCSVHVDAILGSSGRVCYPLIGLTWSKLATLSRVLPTATGRRSLPYVASRPGPAPPSMRVNENEHSAEIGAQHTLSVKAYTYAWWSWRRLNYGRVLVLNDRLVAPPRARKVVTNMHSDRDRTKEEEEEIQRRSITCSHAPCLLVAAPPASTPGCERPAPQYSCRSRPPGESGAPRPLPVGPGGYGSPRQPTHFEASSLEGTL